MASINRLRRELLFKVVFYGPGLGGKTTTLQHVHAATKPENRGNMLSLATDTDRTLYFDYLPVRLLKVGDVTVKLQLYTVPGQVYYAATRKLVLSGADGIVFVADTQAARLDANLESLEDLNANLAEQGRKLSALPHAFQWNKRDLPDLVALDDLDRRFNLFSAPSVPTVATTGDGVFELLERITRNVVEAYRAELPMAGSKPEGMPLFLDADDVGLTDAIKELADSQPARSSSATARLGVLRTRAKSGSHASAQSPASRSVPAAEADPPLPSPVGSTRLAAPASAEAFSLIELWPPADHESVRRVEQLLGARDAAGAIIACHELLSKALASASALLGAASQPREPALVVALLGLDTERYLAFRAAAQGVRAKHDATIREALQCYAFVIEARATLDRVSRGS
ncbi:MAG: GTPase domain-containing protein [Polyangiaceae bacterium]